ncbi:hypothetical protein AB0L55_37315 [Streptomyces anthocyanicus]|uniref:hypothetical protein n=1 Tax=Streptomyces anthocyanicus TaxID=68174 RepID=UPI0034311A8D
MYERFISPAGLLLWAASGTVFGLIWYATTHTWPPIWVRLVAGTGLFFIVTPLEGALARRHARRRRPALPRRSRSRKAA